MSTVGAWTFLHRPPLTLAAVSVLNSTYLLGMIGPAEGRFIRP